MRMPTYRVTEKKLIEIIGEPWVGYFSRFKSKRFRDPLIIILISTTISSILLLIIGYYWVLIGLWLIIILTCITIYLLLKGQFLLEIAQEMRKVVSDPELIWLNSQQAEDVVKHWGRGRGEIYNEKNLHILAYLKKEGCSQGIYQVITSFKNSNSATIALKRLSEKGLIKYENGDFHYLPWEFKLVNENNLFSKDKKSQKMEKVLNKAWEKMLEDY